MHPHIKKLYEISQKPERTVIGLMSGTSLDGLDIALCRIAGSGLETKIKLEAFRTTPYSREEKDLIRTVFSKKSVDLEKLCVLNPWMGQRHAAMINSALKSWSISTMDIDLIASHGQTIYHAPKALHELEGFSNATLQIGDGDHMAFDTGIITVSDFRQKHIAAGGEGAPLAVYGDYLIFGDTDESRIMLNMGGIANITLLPSTMLASDVFSSDVGTGNTLMDAFMQRHFSGLDYDENAKLARSGTANEKLLSALKDNDFFAAPMPKTTGPELFNLDYLHRAQNKSKTQSLAKADVMATLNRFSADVITDALKEAIGRAGQVTVYASGGGAHNPLLMENIRKQVPDVTLLTTASLGIDPDAKEAVLFALLANECVYGARTALGNGREGIPSVTMGKISFPD